MKKLASLALAASMLFGAIGAAHAATEVKMTGDARIYGAFFENRNFTGWNKSGTKTADTFEIWERFRLRADFVANEAVKFRLGIKVEDTWGHGTFTAANPSTSSLAVDLAYLQFKWPGCDIEMTAGLQDVALPQSSMFNMSPVWSDKMAAMVINAPLIDNTLSLLAGFGRLIDTNQSYDNTTTQRADELDAYFMALPITLEGFKITPWGMFAVAGVDAAYSSAKATTDSGDSGKNFANTLLSSSNYNGSSSWKNNQNTFFWAGGAFEVTALDPIRFYADVIYGSGVSDDRKANKRAGWLVDAGVEYTGFSAVTPQLFGWWSTGEDNSTRNGSERMPYLYSQWGPGNSFLFYDGQALGKSSNMNASPVGSMGIGASLKNISFIDKLTNQLTFVYMKGTNSAQALRTARIYGATAATLYNRGYTYVSMGQDLTTEEYLMGVNLDTKYMIYENLAAVMETGWAHGEFQKSVWGRSLVKQSESNGNNAWKVAFGLTYKF